MTRIVALLIVAASSWQVTWAQTTPSLRTWTDSTGVFKVEAQLVRVEGQSVTLKRKDGKELTLPLTKLSQADRDFLNQPPSVGREKSFGIVNPKSSRQLGPANLLQQFPASSGELPSDGHEPPLAEAPVLKSLKTDPARELLAYGKPFTATVCPVDPYDKPAQPFVLDVSQRALAISIGRQVAGQNQSRGRVYRTVYGQQQADLLIDTIETVDLVAHDAHSGRSLLVVGRDELYLGGDLVLIEGLLEGTVRVLVRASLPGQDKPGFKPTVSWAALAGDLAIVQVGEQLFAWDLIKSELVYKVPLEIGGKTAISPGGKYLALGGNGKVLLLEALSGEPLGQIATGTTLIPQLMFDPTGQQLAIGADNRLMIHDLPAGALTSNMTLVSPLGAMLGWTEPGLLLTSLCGLVDVDLELGLWSYSLSKPQRCTAIAGGVLMGAEEHDTLLIQALPLPHPPANRLRARLTNGAAKDLIVQPGTNVSIRIETSEQIDKAAIQAAIESAATQAGWRIQPRAPIELVALIGRAPTKTLNYNMGFGTNAKQESATITPFTSELQIQRGGAVLWRRQSFNHVPAMLFLKDGQTLQQAVSQYEKPEPSFYANLHLPPRILNPEVSKLRGMSRVKEGSWVE